MTVQANQGLASIDGPAAAGFQPVALAGNIDFARLAQAGVSQAMAGAVAQAPRGECVAWGISFQVERPVLLREEAVALEIAPLTAQWLVFMHTADQLPFPQDEHGFPTTKGGPGHLGEQAVDYMVCYDDGTEERVEIRYRHQLGIFQRGWGENCFAAVAHRKPTPKRPHHEQTDPEWGGSQTRVKSADHGPWVNWLFAWENPHPDKAISGFRFEPKSGTIVLSAISAGSASSQPLRWESRRKALLTLPEGDTFDFTLDAMGLLPGVRLDMGQVISAQPRPRYPHETWGQVRLLADPELAAHEVLLEYTAHPDASFHLASGAVIAVKEVQEYGSVGGLEGVLEVVPAATQRVRIRVCEQGNRQPVAVKLHLHGEAGEYLAPVDRHRLPNPAWFEDYSADHLHAWKHPGSYISGETVVDLPLGRVYVEITKGFEIRPLHTAVEITPATDELVFTLERVLPWREQGWVTADTHVHFLSPATALLEGAGEGVNVVNLLASQWGELMTNIGDFDGKTTFGSREAGGDGEYLVRVGTENRQHVLGHISLLGYQGNIIAPMTTGGPDESALGDPIEILLSEWARQCKKQGGVVVLPHFPHPRAEHAAALVNGDVDAIELTNGIDPYSLLDWYRYLNCGYLVAAVGGTDKMCAATAVGAARTYARLWPGEEFSYAAWQNAIRRADTFVSCGPLLDFSVEGKSAGNCLALPAGGGTVTVSWKAASVTMPMTRLELVVNGEIRESRAIDAEADEGEWTVKLAESCWLAVLIRGQYPGAPERIAAHSSPVLVAVNGTPLLAAADALTILEQIEGALAYLDTVGTRADTAAYQRMRLVLTSAHRTLHNRMHANGMMHEHTAVDDHAEHHE